MINIKMINCKYETLTESFIHEHENEVDWSVVSRWQTLTGEFIRAHADRVDWFWISMYQTMSRDIISEFKDRIIMCDNVRFCLRRAAVIDVLYQKVPSCALSMVLMYL